MKDTTTTTTTTLTNIIGTKDFRQKKEPEIKGIKLVLGYFGIFLLAIGIITLVPMLIFISYPSEAKEEYLAYLIPGLIAIFSGIGLSLLIFRRKQGKLTATEDLVLVIGVWVLAILFAAIPYLFYGYTFTQAIYESTSGYTSTGLSIMDWSREVSGEDVVHHALFFHRAFTEFVGGIGLVLIVSSAISERSGLNLYLLEGHNDKLLPNLAKSARLIFSIYLNYIILGSVLYIAVGVTPYDAICHAMTAVATGGFSTKINNINTLVEQVSQNGAWRGVFVEIVSEILMLLGGTNFVIHHYCFKRKFKVLKHFEFIVFFAILILFWPFMIVGTTQYYNGDFLMGLRYGTFEMISAMSTCGFQAIDSYIVHTIGGISYFYPTYLLVILGVLMCVGSQNGSTSGAIKQSRIGLLFLDIWWRIKAAIGKPEQVHIHTTYKFGTKVRVEQEEISEAETFIGFYMAILLVSTLLVSAILYSPVGAEGSFTFTQCFFELSSCLGTVGLGCGITGYTTSPAVLWIEIIVMMLGRLEIFCYFVLGGKMIHNLKFKKNIYDPAKKENPIIDYKNI